MNSTFLLRGSGERQHGTTSRSLIVVGLLFVVYTIVVVSNQAFVSASAGSTKSKATIATRDDKESRAEIQIDHYSHHGYLGYEEGSSGVESQSAIKDFTANTTTGVLQPQVGGANGQLWYTILDSPGPGPGCPGCNPRRVGGYFNSDGSSITQAGPFLSGTATPPTTAYTIAVDTAAGYFFVGNSDHLSISSYRISNNTLVSTVVIGNNFGTPSGLDDELVGVVAVDPINHIVFATRWDSDLAHTGIVKVSYSPSTGILDANAAWNLSPTFLITNASTSGKITYATSLKIDIATHKLYYTDWDNTYNIAPFSPQNSIYVVNDYTAVSPTVTLLTSLPTNGSSGFLGNIAVDNAKSLIYFTTLDFVDPGQARISYMPIGGGATTQIMTLDNLHLGDSVSAGLSLDPVAQQIYINTAWYDPPGAIAPTANANHILQYQLSADGHSFSSLVNSYTMTQLEGQAPTDSGSHPGGSVFNQLPVLSVTGTSTHAAEQGAFVTLASASTSSDADGGFYSGATFQITGGTFSSNETSANDDHLSVLDGVTHRTSGTFTGTNITVAVDGANEKLTLSGYDTIAHYNTVMAALQYNTTGDNPTNYGNNQTRTITWTISDGSLNVPAGSQNSGTTTLTIDAVDDPPVNTVPGAQNVMEGSNLSLALHVSDADADPANQNVTVTLSVLHGKVTVATNVASGLAAGDVTNNGTATVTINATQNKVNNTFNAANSVLYKSGLYLGSETLTMLSNDQNHTGSGGPLTDSDNVSITVTKPLIDYVEQAPGTCGNNDPCYPSVQSAINDLASGGTTNVVGGTFNESVTLSQNEMLSINGATTINDFTLSVGTLNGNAATLTILGNWAKTGGTFNPGTGTVMFAGNGNTQTLTGNTSFGNLMINHTGINSVTASGSTLAVTGLLRVQSGTFTSSSTFNNVQIDSGATLASDGGTMNVTGNWTNNGGTFSPNGNTVSFNGNGAQAIGGSAVAQSFNNLIVNKSGGTLTASVNSLTTNDFTLTAGTFTAPATLDINGNTVLTGTFTAGGITTAAGNWTNNGGSFTPGSGTVTFDGAAGQTIGGTVATTFNNLTNSDAGGLVMTGDNSVSGVLALTSSDLTVAATKTLTQPSTVASTGTFDVVGAVKRTGGPFAAATLITFGNPNNQITFGVAGTKPTDMTVTLAKAPPATYAAAVQRNYNVAMTGGSGYTATFRLRYLDPEVTGLNTEATLNLRRLRTGDNHWVAQLPTVADAANNWVESNAVLAADLPTQWTFSSLAPTASDGSISGRITDAQGRGVEGAVVRLDGTQSRKFITDANGFYRFDNVETSGFYTVIPSRVNYTFSPATRSFSQLGEATEATFGATLATSNLQNPLDTPEYFVRQHYLDFLDREPDEGGFNFWSDQILECGADRSCIDRKRENVSAAYFLSIEFQQTGGLVDGLYRASYATSPQYSAFMLDAHTIGLGVRVGADGWQAKLEANKAALVNAFANRPAFHQMYDSMDNSLFVDTLIQHTGVSFTAADRDALVMGLGTGTMTRGEALRSIAENQSFVNAKFNQAFVMMEYFGYLRREADSGGYSFWLNKLNEFNGNFEQAEMVKAFIVSGEYRDRFSR